MKVIGGKINESGSTEFYTIFSKEAKKNFLKSWHAHMSIDLFKTFSQENPKARF